MIIAVDFDGTCTTHEYPHIGRERDADLGRGLRSFAVGQYVIIYRFDQTDVLILHVFRGSRDIEALLRQ